MQKETILIYETAKKEKGLILTDSLFTKDVTHKGDSVIITKAWYGESIHSSDIHAKENLDIYVYHPKNKLTDRIFYDADKDNQEAYQRIVSKYKDKGKDVIEKKWEKYSKRIYAKGRVHLPITDTILPHESIPASRYKYKATFAYKFKASIKGEYLGTEVLKTEAGTFSCAKIQYIFHRKALWMSSKDTVTEWYAKGIGLVKSETHSKKGELIKTCILKSITPSKAHFSGR